MVEMDDMRTVISLQLPASSKSIVYMQRPQNVCKSLANHPHSAETTKVSAVNCILRVFCPK
jgi:hypothetical protein